VEAGQLAVAMERLRGQVADAVRAMPGHDAWLAQHGARA